MTTTYIQLTPAQLTEAISTAVNETVKAAAEQGRVAMIGKVEYYTAEQAAQMIGVTVETIRKYSRDGRLRKRGGKSNAQYHVDVIEMFVWQQTGTKHP